MLSHNALKTSFVVSKNKRAAQKTAPRALLLLSKESFGDDDDDDVNDACTLLLLRGKEKSLKDAQKREEAFLDPLFKVLYVT